MTSAWLCGCSSLDHTAHNRSIPKGESIVFGSIAISSADSRQHLQIKVTVINTRTSQTVLEHSINGPGGAFYWSLPPGQYAILDLYEHDFFNGDTSSSRIYAQFSIDAEQTVTYVGTLALATSPSSLSHGSFSTSDLKSSTLSSIHVTDEFDTAVQTFHKQFTAIDITPIKKLLSLEK